MISEVLSIFRILNKSAKSRSEFSSWSAASGCWECWERRRGSKGDKLEGQLKMTPEEMDLTQSTKTGRQPSEAHFHTSARV